MIHVDLTGAAPFFGAHTPDYAAAEAAHRTLSEKTGAGSDFLGWTELPRRIRETELARILAAGKTIREKGDALVVVGIGGSYLGARAAYELIGRREGGAELLFAGNGLSAATLRDTIEKLGDRNFCVNVVSKSGTTLEPALGFRVFRDLLVKKYGEEEANSRIFATTDARRGALKSEADAAGWESFVVPDDVGGRFSVLSAVGLLPMAVAGIDVRRVIDAAIAEMDAFDLRSPENPAWQYAAARQLLYGKGYSIELLACYEPSFRFMAEWWKQLYGESEGKDGKGIFPASVEFNADLHSMGQFIQDGPRTLMESVVRFTESRSSLVFPFEEDNADSLNYLAGRKLSEISLVAADAVKEAHITGGVPNIVIEVQRRDEEGFAALVCFFEMACAISGYMSRVNPFNQPGVEEYKKNMFRMLGKPGAK